MAPPDFGSGTDVFEKAVSVLPISRLPGVLAVAVLVPTDGEIWGGAVRTTLVRLTLTPVFTGLRGRDCRAGACA